MTDTQNLLLSAANDVAKVQVEAIKQAVIAEMSKLDATGPTRLQHSTHANAANMSCRSHSPKL